MSGSNAISGITLVGALISSTRLPEHGTLTACLRRCAVFLATINVVGGYVVTDRMLGHVQEKPGGK
jgi:NAD(P) transhydrogenase subunit alpha